MQILQQYWCFDKSGFINFVSLIDFKEKEEQSLK